MGFEPDDAMLPYQSRSFDGYRLLREYFAFPERYRFIRIGGIKEALKDQEGDSFDIVIHLSRRRSELENIVDKSSFLPFCTPAVNIFPKRADRIHINDRDYEFHVVPDRSKPTDFEIYRPRTARSSIHSTRLATRGMPLKTQPITPFSAGRESHLHVSAERVQGPVTWARKSTFRWSTQPMLPTVRIWRN
jgi:type VI secretion system protein ImpG